VACQLTLQLEADTCSSAAAAALLLLLLLLRAICCLCAGCFWAAAPAAGAAAAACAMARSVPHKQSDLGVRAPCGHQHTVRVLWQHCKRHTVLNVPPNMHGWLLLPGLWPKECVQLLLLLLLSLLLLLGAVQAAFPQAHVCVC
jgi:hypothetical protein